jgi:succinate dehydrogenase / fumarate reductase, cytochrome b subunit
VLIAAVVLHIHAAYSLTVLNRKARSVKYQSARDYQIANFASRTMRWTGIIVVLFIAGTSPTSPGAGRIPTS